MSRFKVVSVLVLMLTFSFCFNQEAVGQVNGNWQVSIRPYLFSENSPLSVSSVSTDFSRGGMINKIGLDLGENGKRKQISRFKVGWVLVDESRGDKIIGSGESADIFFNPTNRVIRLGKSIFAFNSFIKELGLMTLNGKYRVDVMVSYVDFMSGEKWKFNLPTNNFMKTKFVKASKKSISTAEACPNQTCSWNNETSSFYCNNVQGFACVNSTNGQSCTSSKCESGGELDLIMEGSGR